MEGADQFFANLPTLETARLRLRKLRLSDAADFYAYARDPEVARFTTWTAHTSVDDSRAFIINALSQYGNGLVGQWGVEHKADRRIIGTCGFAYCIAWHHRAEVAYALARPYWRQGYMTEAMHAVLAAGFDQLALNRIEARCEVDNLASERVMQKVGMRFEGVLRQHMLVKGSYRDLKLYAILREEWGA